MRPRIALATYDRAPDLAPDDQLLIPALARAGIDGEAAVWSDDSVIWETFDGVVIRSCWDYHRRIDEFRGWLDRLDASRLPVFNSIATVTWNSNKRYLQDLATRGVSTIDTLIVPRGDVEDASLKIEALGSAKVVVKPAISASGYETHALSIPLDADARATLRRVVDGSDTLVQPFAEEIQRDGELSLVFIDGAFSHSAVKRASAGEFRVQVEHGGSVSPIEVSGDVVGQATSIVATLDEKPLYARVDGMVRDGRFVLMELELIEPHLFLSLDDESADRFARALGDRLKAV